MAKELPYFKFEPAEYLTKDISFCSLQAQGLFINVCAYYWQRGCKLTKTQLLKRLNFEQELNELIDEGVIDIKNENISIKFLDTQLKEVVEKSKTNSVNGSKGGRPKKPKQNPIKSEIKPNENRNESESKGIRLDKIREEEIREEKINIFYLTECLNSYEWIENLARNKKTKIDTVKLKLNEFFELLYLKGDEKESLKDFKSHFVSWFNIQIESEKPNPFKNNVF